uniref:Ubiquitin-conjugating enzyme E2G 1b (UBC7 homolog, yeast) n=1 Tax=Cynoglossus semilaevis TaxID=244447 RepID=A0A3P8WSE1_CYNSE
HNESNQFFIFIVLFNLLTFKMTEQSSLLLRKQLAELNKNPVEGFSAGLINDDDIYQWEVVVMGPRDTLYEGGVFKATLFFPRDYPLKPPKMTFVTEIWHPNFSQVFSLTDLRVSSSHPGLCRKSQRCLTPESCSSFPLRSRCLRWVGLYSRADVKQAQLISDKLQRASLNMEIKMFSNPLR